MSDNGPNARNRPRLRIRLFHLMFLLTRPATLGVRVIVHDRRANAVFLVRHTYVAGWHLPGGGVENGESCEEALARELAEEGNITLNAPPRLVSLHFNRLASKRDHVALYLVDDFAQPAPKQGDREIAEARFFALDALPDGTTMATRARLKEVFGAAAPSSHW